MDQNLPIVTKKLWNMVRIAFYILKKSINKKKILLDLNLFIKKGKFVAEKTLTNLLFHHHHHSSSSSSSNNNNNNNNGINNNHNVSNTIMDDEFEFFSCTNTPLYLTTPKKACCSRTPTRATRARQLRITDSPYPISNEGGDVHVDQAADEFIKRFYSQLIKQQQE